MIINIINKLRAQSYLIALLIMAVAMPLSKALLSISLALLVLAWLISPGFKNRIKLLKSRKSIWYFVIGYLLVVIGLLYSSNISRNLFLLGSIKISLVILPIILGTFTPLNKNHLKYVFLTFTGANFLASVISTFILFGIIERNITDARQISVFIENIRFALLLAINIFFLAFLFKFKLVFWLKLTIGIIIIWFLVFLCFLQALTGLAALVITSVVLFIVFQKMIKKIWLVSSVIGLIIICISCFYYVRNAAIQYQTIHDTNLLMLDSVTINGNLYQHNKCDTFRVNGYLSEIYVCEPELRNEWTKRSKFPFDSADLRGWSPIKETLKLYLTSMGLRKDSATMAKLSDADIRYIEKGYTNKLIAGVGLKARIFDVVREFDSWKRTGKPDGSVTIRLNALVNGWKVFKSNPWFGTGYGDINDDIQSQYEKDNSVFGEPMRQNPHNQFLTVLIGAGVIGFVIFLITLLMPGFIEKKYKSYIFLVAFCITILSFLSDDTLERMVGCVIMAFFFSLALFAIPKELDSD